MNVVEAPDIINPFNVKTVFYIDESAQQDLNLEVLIDSAVGKVGRKVPSAAQKVLCELVDDTKTIVYRQDALEELVTSEELRKKVCSLVENLDRIGGVLQKFHYCPELENGANLLREYISFINDLPPLGLADSKALQEVHAYFERVKCSQTFRETVELLKRIENLGSVHFRVSFDEKCRPVSMTALALHERKKEEPQEQDPEKKGLFWQRILRRRREEPRRKEEQEQIEQKALRDQFGRGLNDLGREIYTFIASQFVSVMNEYAEQIKELTSPKFLSALAFYADFSHYFAKLQKEGFHITRPTFLPKEERRTVIRNAKNPVIVSYKNNGSEVVPNDIVHTPDENMFVITGPNNGGKTTHIKTVGLLQVLTQSGLLVPAESAKVSLVDGIYTHFVAPDDITKGEGRYRNELQRMKYIFEHASPFSLVILDEPCGGTSYEEGQRQSVALLAGFHTLGSTTYFTTHLHPVTSHVENGQFPAARNLSVDCIASAEKLRYTFKIKSGASGKSYGEEIAREIGLRPENIDFIVTQRAAEKGYTHLLRK